MLDAFTRVVSQADNRGQLVNDSQIDALLAMVKEGAKRTDVVNRITSNSSAIVTNAARALFSKFRLDGFIFAFDRKTDSVKRAKFVTLKTGC